MESGTPRFEKVSIAPDKAPPGAVAAAILTIIYGAYSIIAAVIAAVVLISGVKVTLPVISPIISIALIYSGYAILKCRTSEYGKGLWLVILLSVILSIFLNLNGYASLPVALVLLFILFRYGGYINAISTCTVIISFIASAWIYVMVKSGHTFFIVEFAVTIAPLLVILILLCLNWREYKVCMHPKIKKDVS